MDFRSYRIQSFRPVLVYGVIVLLAAACQSTPKPKEEPDSGGAAAEAPAAKEKEKEKETKTAAKEPEEPSVEVSATMAPLTYSVQNGSITFHGVNREKAAAIAESLNGKLAKPNAKDHNGMVGLIAMQSVAGLPIEELFSSTRRLIEIEMAKDINKDVGDLTTLHLALAALNVHNISMAEHFIYKLIDTTKSKKIEAAAYVIEGIIALMDERLPEAVASWQSALKEDPDCRAANLNVAFLALRYGDFKTARAHLGKVDDDPYASYGNLVASRIEGKAGEVEEICGKFLGNKKKYRPAVFSCALHEYQAKHNYKKAVAMINDMLKDGRGPTQLDERANRVLDLLAQEHEADERQKMEKKAKATDAKGGQESGKKGSAGGGEAKGEPKGESKGAPAGAKK